MKYAVQKIVGPVRWRLVESAEDCGAEDTFVTGALPANAVWDGVAVRSATATELLETAKAARIAAIKAKRDELKFEGVYVGANRFHSDADSRTQQLGLVLLGANVPPVEWKTLTPDGIPDSYVTMTPTLAQQIFGATATRDIACFNNAKTLIASVNAAQTVEAVEAVDISTGWPE